MQDKDARWRLYSIEDFHLQLSNKFASLNPDESVATLFKNITDTIKKTALEITGTDKQPKPENS